MSDQKFVPLLNRAELSQLVDTLRYENADLSQQLKSNENEIVALKEKLRKTQSDLDALQAVIDMQNAQWYAERNTQN